MGPGVANLITMAQACDPSLTRDSFIGLRYGDLKKRVTEAVLARLEPIQRKYAEITADPAYIDSVLTEGRGPCRSNRRGHRPQNESRDGSLRVALSQRG